MHNIHIAGTGIWFPEQKVTNEEIVNSYNSYVENFNKINKESIDKGSILPMEYSSAEFIEKASGIKSRYMIDKEGSLDINRMMPRVDNEHPDRLSIRGIILLMSKEPSLSIMYLDFIPDAFSINSTDEYSIGNIEPLSIDSLLILLKFST